MQRWVKVHMLQLGRKKNNACNLSHYNHFSYDRKRLVNCFILLQSCISMFSSYYNLTAFYFISNVMNNYHRLQHKDWSEAYIRSIFIDIRLVLLTFPIILYYSKQTYLYIEFHQQYSITLNKTFISNSLFLFRGYPNDDLLHAG